MMDVCRVLPTTSTHLAGQAGLDTKLLSRMFALTYIRGFLQEIKIVAFIQIP
jgi:hypothetical protein